VVEALSRCEVGRWLVNSNEERGAGDAPNSVAINQMVPCGPKLEAALASDPTLFEFTSDCNFVRLVRSTKKP
jgi:hypothetical protein